MRVIAMCLVVPVLESAACAGILSVDLFFQK